MVVVVVVVVSEGVVPMAPTLDTVGFFARDAATMSAVGYALIGTGASPRGNKRPAKLLILEDALDVSSAPVRAAMLTAAAAARAALGERGVGYLSLKRHLLADADASAALAPFAPDNGGGGAELRGEGDVWPALLEALGALQGYEFWRAHGAWVSGNRERIGEVIMRRIAPGEHRSARAMELALAARAALRRSLEALLRGGALLMLPTLPARPVRRALRSARASADRLASFRRDSRTLIALASLAGAPQLAMPVRSRAAAAAAAAGEAGGAWEPSVSLMGRPGADLLVLDFAVRMERCIQDELRKERAPAAASAASAASASAAAPAPPPAAASACERERTAGNAKLAAGDVDGAIVHYTAAIAAEPSSAPPYGNRALAYLKLELYELAERDCDSCLRLDPRAVKALLRRGCARSMLHRLPEALEDFNEVLRLEPRNRQAREERERIRAYAMSMAAE